MVGSWANQKAASLDDSMVGLTAPLSVDLMVEHSVAPSESRLGQPTAVLTVASTVDH